MHTPGHTHHHVSYVLRDTEGIVHGAFTGGSMLHGTTGRTDLLGDEHAEALTHAQYHSVRRLADELPADTKIFPTHGFGSFCSATPASGDSSTIADELVTNPALTKDEQTYVIELLAGLSDYPAYYAHMGVINKAGPPPVDLSMPETGGLRRTARSYRGRRMGCRPAQPHCFRRTSSDRHPAASNCRSRS